MNKLAIFAKPEPDSRPVGRICRGLSGLMTILVFGLGSSGCTSLTQPISGIPSTRLPPQFFFEEKNSLVPIDYSLLGQEAPRQYLLDKGDVIGVYVERVLPFTEPDAIPVMPPVNFPDQGSLLPPSTGFPFTILEDGTVSLPLLKPLKVRGLTLDQTRDLIRRAYIEAKILREDDNQFVSPVVTLIRERTYNIVVIRQDSLGISAQPSSGRGLPGRDESARGNVVKLPAYQNDILHALMETGGLPGLGAKNEVKVMRASRADQAARAAFIRQYGDMVAAYCDPCSCPPPMPEDPTVLRIPLRLPVGVVPSIRPEDVLLEDGDIVVVETRENEFYYTGGLLPPGQWALPRDYDLDVLGAMAIAGSGIASPQQGGGGGGGGLSARSIGGVPPGRLYILRRTPCKGQIAIEVDIANAINNPGARPIVQPGDTLILQYRPCEEALNFGIGSFFTYGIGYLFRSGNN